MFEYYAALLLLAVLAQVTMLAILKADHLISKRSKKLFINVFLLLLLNSYCEWYYYSNLNSNVVEGLSMDVAIYVIQLITPTLPFMVALIFREIKYAVPIYGLLILNLIIHTLTFTDLFYLSGQNILSFGNMYIIDEGIFLVSLFLLFSSVYSICKKYQSTNLYILVLIVITIAIATITRSISNNLRVTVLTATTSIVFLYAYYSELVNKLDSLTLLLNRRCFNSRVANIKKNCSIIILDLNKFKEINDTKGHTFGDYILKEIASIIKETYINYGVCFRTGGDEFCVLIESKAVDIDELNKLVQAKIVEGRKVEPLLPNLSVGYANYIYGKDDIDEVMKLADQMMYADKKRKKELSDVEGCNL